MIIGRTFPNCNVTPAAHGALFAGMISDGVLTGCTLSTSGKTLNISAGFLMVGGREVEIVANEAVTVTKSSGYARVVARINTAALSETDSFEQFRFEVQYGSSATDFPALSQGNINGGSATIYEATLCVLELGDSIRNITSRMGRAAARGVVWLDSDPGDGAAVPYADGVILAVS